MSRILIRLQVIYKKYLKGKSMRKSKKKKLDSMPKWVGELTKIRTVIEKKL